LLTALPSPDLQSALRIRNRFWALLLWLIAALKRTSFQAAAGSIPARDIASLGHPLNREGFDIDPTALLAKPAQTRLKVLQVG